MNKNFALKNKFYLFISVAGVTFALDIYTKYLVKANMRLSESISVLKDYIQLTFIYNRGAAFGITFGDGSNYIFLFLSSIATLLIILYYFFTPMNLLYQRIGLSLICGGALGNLLDRIRYEKVTDFIDCGYGDLRWPIFNIADIAVTIGAVIFGIAYLKSSRRDERPHGGSPF